MDHYKKSLFDIKNITMIRDISLDKIKQLTGIVIDPSESFYRIPFNEIVKEVSEYSQEFETVTKANSVIIKELVNFIVKKINMQHSTSLDDINDENEIEEIRQPIDEKVQVKQQKNIFTEEIYCFDMDEMTNENGRYYYDLYLKNVKEIKVISCTIDNSDYILNENNNTLEIDNQIIKIPVGNYNAIELTEKIQEIIDITINSKTENFCKIEIKVSRYDDCFSFEFQKLFSDKKSLTGSIKEAQLERSILVDLSCNNSIYSLIGFQPKTYKIIVGDKIVGKKHKINFTTHVKMNLGVMYQEKIIGNINQRILMDVPYNSTKFFISQTSNSIVPDQLLDFDRISISFSNSESKIYNTRDRVFSVEVLIKKLI